MSGKRQCDHCLHKCFTEKIPDCRDPKKRPKTINILFNEIKEKLSSGKNKNISLFIFVEGNLDEKFWNKIKQSDSIGVIKITNPSCEDNFTRTGQPPTSPKKFIKSNKSAIECLFCRDHTHLLADQYSFEIDLFLTENAIGMVDWDFQHPEPSSDSNYDPDKNIRYDPGQFFPLFRTETRDFEILLCKCGGLKQFFTNHTAPGLIGTGNAQEELLDQATIPGFARYLNADKKYFIKFDRLKREFGINPFCDFICDKKILTCSDIADLLRKNANNLHGRPSLFFAFFRAQCPRRMQLVDNYPWSICQGHDTMQILECMIRCGRIKYKKYPPVRSDRDISEKILEEVVEKNSHLESETIKQMREWIKNRHPEREMTH